jgi:hypothetical protein
MESSEGVTVILIWKSLEIVGKIGSAEFVRTFGCALTRVHGVGKAWNRLKG